MLRDPGIAVDPRDVNNSVRTSHREALEATVQAVFGRLSDSEAVDRLIEAATAYGAIN